MSAVTVDWSDREAAADYLASIALELAGRVREDNPARVLEWLRRRIPAAEWPALAVVMAAHIDIDRPQSELIGWALDADDPARWRHFKAEYERLRSSGVNVKDMPDDVRRGESRYNTALRRSRVRAAQVGAA